MGLKRTPMIGLISLAAVLLLAGSCSANTANAPNGSSGTPVTPIDRDKAITLAIGDCQMPHYVLVSEPENIRAQLMSLREANQLTKIQGETTSFELSLDSWVWLVEMDGLFQLVGGPLPPPTATGQAETAVVLPTRTPSPGSCQVILDANTGDFISIHG